MRLYIYFRIMNNYYFGIYLMELCVIMRLYIYFRIMNNYYGYRCILYTVIL